MKPNSLSFVLLENDSRKLGAFGDRDKTPIVDSLFMNSLFVFRCRAASKDDFARKTIGRIRNLCKIPNEMSQFIWVWLEII